MFTLDRTHAPKPHVLMVGSISDGYAVYGPFASYEEARGYMFRACPGNRPDLSGDHSQIMELVAPPPPALGRVELI